MSSGIVWHVVEVYGEQGAQTSIAQYVLGRFAAYDQSPVNSSQLVPHGAVAVGPVHLFQFSVSIDRNKLVRVPRRAPLAHHRLNLRTDDGPDFRPTFNSWLSDGGWVFISSKAGPIAVVIKLNKFGTPPQKHGVTRPE